MYRYTERKYGLPITPSTIMQELPLVVKRSAPSADIKTPRGMFLMILWLFALSQNNETAATPRHVDDVILKFITDASPVLFPPPRILLHSCIDHDDTIKLSKEMSSNGLSHSIRNSHEEFDRGIYDSTDHRNLYVLDLNCDYAIEVLRQAHSAGMFVAPAKWLLLQDRRTTIVKDDNANSIFTYDDSVLEVFEDLAVYPDSDVVLASRYEGDFIQLTSVYRPSPQRGIIWENRGNWTIQSGLRMRTFDVASARRRNLHRTHLKSAFVITNPDSLNHLTDFKDPFVDAMTKISYPWILHLASRMNATISYEITNNWGYQDKNGSWNGLMGMLHRREIDIGGTCLYITANRMDAAEFVQLYTAISAYFIFRRPLLSTMKNIFILPFQRDVWIAIAIFLLLVFCLLYLSMKWEHYRGFSAKSAKYWNQFHVDKPTAGDDILVLLGAVAQQGYSYEPYRVSPRIITLMLLMASLSLYAAYTANIVALLQSTTNSIRTLSDLLHSPLILGVHDTVYNRYYFRTFQDPVRKAITEQKVEPKGRKPNWMNLTEGVQRIRSETFAFHSAWPYVYKIIQETFQEEEKCGLAEIDYLKQLAYPLLPIQKQSPYAEIIKNWALKMREYGLKYREEYRIYTKKPVCSSQTGFITIGFTECYFAIVAIIYGMLLSMIVFAFELLWYKRQSKDTNEVAEETVSGAAEQTDFTEHRIHSLGCCTLKRNSETSNLLRYLSLRNKLRKRTQVDRESSFPRRTEEPDAQF